jgi:hypothetical protein
MCYVTKWTWTNETKQFFPIIKSEQLLNEHSFDIETGNHTTLKSYKKSTW